MVHHVADCVECHLASWAEELGHAAAGLSARLALATPCARVARGLRALRVDAVRVLLGRGLVHLLAVVRVEDDIVAISNDGTSCSNGRTL